MLLELVPFRTTPRLPTPHAATAQIVCCAHAVWAFPNADAYSRQTPSNRRIQAGSLRPISETDVPEVPLSYRQSPVTLGLATGVVRRAIRHVNPATDQPYYWLSLETRRATLDVLANPTHVSGDISTGHIVQVCGSFLARLAGTPT